MPYLEKTGAEAGIKRRPLHTDPKPPTNTLTEEQQLMDEDRLDRNNRNISESGERLYDKFHTLSTQVAVMSSKLDAVAGTMQTGFSQVDATFQRISDRYATKEDISAVSKDIEEVRKNISRGVWVVIAAVVMGLLSLVFKPGLLHV